MTGSTAMAIAILTPLAAAVACLVAGPRGARTFGLAGALATLASAVAVVHGVIAEGTIRHAVGGWGAPLGIDLEADGLSALMLAMTAVVGAAISVYARAYFEPGDRRGAGFWFWPLWFFLWAALHALFLTADVFNYYVTLELGSIAAVALVALGGTATAVVAATRYLLFAIVGSLLYLLGIGLLYGQYGVLDIALLHEVAGDHGATRAAYLCIVAGLVLKTALVPLHIWLPPAHSSAPAPVSAALSALVVKGSFYILLRFHVDILPADLVAAPSHLLGALGAVAVVWGSIQALRQPRIKLVIAYSTVAQVGYLFLLFPLVAVGGASGAEWPAKAWSGGIYHALSHAFAKASLFLAAGAVLHAAGHDRLEALRGIGERMPMTVTALALASISIMGLPPSGGFIGKWLLLVAALHEGHLWWVVAILAGGLLAAAYSFRMLKHAFRPAEAGAAWHETPRTLEWVALALAAASILLGLAAVLPLGLLQIGAPFPANSFLEAL